MKAHCEPTLHSEVEVILEARFERVICTPVRIS